MEDNYRTMPFLNSNRREICSTYQSIAETFADGTTVILQNHSIKSIIWVMVHWQQCTNFIFQGRVKWFRIIGKTISERYNFRTVTNNNRMVSQREK
jgi:hypothetical protein